MGSQVVCDNSSENHSQFQPLVRQNSMYNLTLDEVQSQLGDLGKPLSSMNLDELLKNVWTVEANQSQSIQMDNANVAQASQAAQAAQTGQAGQGQVVLQHQPNMPLVGELSKKTVDEVWRDIQQTKDHEEVRPQERQSTLGEMTLEDFLVKAGVVSVASSNGKSTTNSPSPKVDSSLVVPQFVPHGPWMQQYAQAHYPHPQQNVMPTYVPNQLLAQPLHMVAAGSPMDVVPYADGGQVAMASQMGNLSDSKKSGLKRGVPDEKAERTVERKQKRMIKNRESAARSRARKQAYTTELEIKVNRLEEENEMLRKEKELTNMIASVPPPEPKCQLRRVSSAEF
ncbi:ABSCISIC ACID-INSENSITIVE 5-like protein 2 [Vicia villosa]|uniref:ABSCISIC ACID-INSENSITIVE 5-like protein 2 n=1 Tax=Vicia villosa TaxID=3911 RepID=UPI00273BE970|nr:ABSCISIC ACID-INSENSITIVE 5-like protein 2 [Vicia villosa]XP_058782766.1 ABSCISIC ACID-INSENSITIVE 5-like protein 2 [Vicia villosa]XP_058782768.1 ABSCISIC ACID-INSENSITIVE 5-like protein 2 [Vicia villosa]XP_058782769.1 ABSCISIC ACID-INSENSITIVE 5-like protein 2 [Vicia villosa]